MYHPKRIQKGSSSNHHFFKGEPLNFKGCITSNFLGCRGSHKSGVSFQLPRVFLKFSRVILSTTDGLAGSIGILTMKFLSMICGFLWINSAPKSSLHFCECFDGYSEEAGPWYLLVSTIFSLSAAFFTKLLDQFQRPILKYLPVKCFVTQSGYH